MLNHQARRRKYEIKIVQETFLKEHIFSHFEIPHAIISDNGTQFYNRTFEALMQKYAITHKTC